MSKKSPVSLSPWMAGLFVVGMILVWMFVLVQKPKYLVKDVLANGTLELNDSRKISLAGVKMPVQGEIGYEAGIFFLSQMTKNIEVWPEAQRDGYKVWIGCKNILGFKDCKNGILINEALIKAGVAVVK